MYTRRFLLIVHLALGAIPVIAQEADTTDYFPLEIGNSWTYYALFQHADGSIDTTVFPQPIIADTVSVNDTLYYRVPHPNAFSDTLRWDGEGRIWARHRTADMLLYDFTVEEGEKYYVDFSEADWDTYEVRIERNVSVDVVAGHFENCILLYFNIPEGADTGHTYIFAPNVGIVTSYDGMGEGSFLYEAVVDGRVVSSTEVGNPTSRREIAAHAFPNPFTTATTVILPAKTGPAPKALVYDVLGRQVAKLTASGCEPGQCAYRWDGSGLPPGYYHVVPEGGRGRGIALMHR